MELNGKIEVKEAIGKSGKPYKAIFVTLPTIDKKETVYRIFPKATSDWRLLGIDPNDSRFFQ